MYKFHHSRLPDIFSGFYTHNHEIHDHNTRQYGLLHPPKIKSFSIIRAKGVKTDNYFSKYIDHNCSISIYKKRLKVYIIENNITFLLNWSATCSRAQEICNQLAPMKYNDNKLLMHIMPNVSPSRRTSKSWYGLIMSRHNWSDFEKRGGSQPDVHNKSR